MRVDTVIVGIKYRDKVDDLDLYMKRPRTVVAAGGTADTAGGGDMRQGTSIEDRFWAKVNRQGADECWPWIAGTTSRGYGSFRVGSQMRSPHCIAYEWLVGPIPEGLELDHTCHNDDPSCLGGDKCLHRRCVNPAHLEPVTHQTNTLRGKTNAGANARKTHCLHGHPFIPGNLYLCQGHRSCRQCSMDRARARRTR